MILDKFITVHASCRNKPFYEAKGYVIPHYIDKKGRKVVKKGTKIQVRIEDAQPHTNIPISYSCDGCGNINTVKYYTIFTRKNSQYQKTGETFCSNCANKRMSGENNGQYKHGSSRFCEYRNNAEKRGHKFELTHDFFKEITSKECFYCGMYSTDFNDKSRGNGIDRVDSSIGYIESNCVPSCSRCNFLKNTMTKDVFLGHIKNIYERHFK